MKHLTRWSCIAIFLCIAATHGIPADDPQSILKDALRQYNAGNFDATIVTIRTYLNSHGKEPSTEYLVPLLVESYSRTGECAQIGKLFAIFEKKFPASAFLPRLWYIQGLCACKNGVPDVAVTCFSRALQGGVSDTLVSLCQLNTEKLCTTFGADQLHALATRDDFDPRIREITAYYECIRLARTGSMAAAKEHAANFLRTWPHSRYETALRTIVPGLPGLLVSDTAKQLSVGKIVIGVLTPLTGFEEEMGRRVLQGIELALRLYNASASTTLELAVCDTRGNMVETARKTSELITKKVPIILGPMLSSEAVVSAAMVAGKNIVMITPTATDDGIAELGPTSFQMNVPLGMLARSIAWYAQQNMTMREFAIFAPLSEYGMVMARSFRAEVEKNGGRIVAEEFFDEETNDFRPQCMELRAQLVKEHIAALARDRGMTPEKYANVVLHNQNDSTLYTDSSLAISGMFIPAESERIVMLAPQLSFFRIKTQILGSNGWHSAKVIIDGKKYVNDAIFSTNFQSNADSKQWAEFAKTFKAAFGTEPDRTAALGFDAMNVAISALTRTGFSSDAAVLSTAIKSVQSYSGAAGNISFDPERNVNTEAVIMKIKNQTFVRIQ